MLASIAMGGMDAQAVPSPVRVVTADDRKACKYLGLVTVRKAVGPDKPNGALKKALAKAAEMGGNGLFIINQGGNVWEGASVSGEALLCPDGVFF